tara:strand:+ start:4723 stop:4836 length:114 start_codon:yes stop_codon:yes gene_type:complete
MLSAALTFGDESAYADTMIIASIVGTTSIIMTVEGFL